jgi:hypothetical protein
LIHDLFTQDQVGSIRKGNRAFWLQGILEYCDEFGRYSCRSFSLSFNGLPMNAFVEDSDIDCANAYFYPPRRPDQTYLPPCEQPAEREQRQEKEEREIAARAGRAPTATPTPAPSPN